MTILMPLVHMILTTLPQARATVIPKMRRKTSLPRLNNMVMRISKRKVRNRVAKECFSFSKVLLEPSEHEQIFFMEVQLILVFHMSFCGHRKEGCKAIWFLCPAIGQDRTGGGELRKLIEGLGKLALTDYKAYLRSNGLRLSGTKEECIQRIIEHWRIKDGNGQRQYPRSSFTINCTGDVCKGDVVLFQQKVYKKFEKMRRGGEQSGKRTIAGRIVKESYGAAKQQHTFTVEVLWSLGVKQLPPLFPLLVKGRNLYKMKTFRQRWRDEEERLEVLGEKHKRGDAARFIRATRKSKSTKPTKASSKNKGNKRQKLDHHMRPSKMMQTSNVKKHNHSIDERGKAMAGSKRTKKHQRKPYPPGRLNLAEASNCKPPMRNPSFVPAVRETSLQFNYPPATNFRQFESYSYSHRIQYSHSSNWCSAPRSHLGSYSSYTLPVPEHQRYGHGSYPNSSYARYVSQSNNYPHPPGMLGIDRSSDSIPFVNYERRWNS